MWKKLSGWANKLAVISVSLIVLFLVLAIIILSTVIDLGVLSAYVFLAYIIVIIGMWTLGFMNATLVLKKKIILANLISAAILAVLLFYFGWALIWQLMNYPEQIGTFVQNAFWIIPYLIVVVYLIISLIKINK